MLRLIPLAALLLLSACAPTAPPPPAAPAPPVAGVPPTAQPAPGASPAAPAPTTLDASTLPGPAREFRAAWIATVANIDWPSRHGLTAAEQQAELIVHLDRLAGLHFNAVVLQVRPVADALYRSELEPWSEFLTGTEGRDPGYDPLAFAIRAAHARGLQLHAWFNPYRAGHPSSRGPNAASHISRTRPDLVRRYGTNRWLDPGEPAAADHSLAVILDVVRRYDIDGVHLDDYFYPYPVEAGGRETPFPDAESYARARAAGETLGRDDWRRQNVNRLIERLYREVKAAKPHVLVGISPFGIWRPGHPAGVTGFDQYAKIYADARLWQVEGWLDYSAPQLYWARASRGQPFGPLMRWWGEQNTAGRHLWPGLYTSRAMPDPGGYSPEEVVGQVEEARADAVATGTIHFSAKALADRYGVGPALLAGPYAQRALVPASPWLDDAPPDAPRVAVEGRTTGVEATWEPAPGEGVAHWVVRERQGGAWRWTLVPGPTRTHTLAPGVEAVAVSAVDRAGNESRATLAEVR